MASNTGKYGESATTRDGLLLRRPSYAWIQKKHLWKIFDSYSYTVQQNTGLLDYAEIEKLAEEINLLSFLQVIVLIRGRLTLPLCVKSQIR